MKKAFVYGGLAALSLGLVFATGCEWTGGGGTNSFNTSKGAGVNLNFSGVYNGTFSGGKAVASSSGAPITRFVLTQSGNAVEVIDNNGNRYKGNVGSPGVVFTPTTENPIIPTGALLMEGQITFEGVDGSSGKDVEFVGVIHAVAITDIKSTTTVDRQGSTNSSSSSSSSNDDQSGTVTKTVDNGTNTTTTVTVTTVTPEVTIQTVTTVVTDNATGAELSRNVTKTSSQNQTQGQGQSSGTTTTTTYQITEANTQYRLEGTWLEKGGNTSDVDALSPATSGLVTTTAAGG